MGRPPQGEQQPVANDSSPMVSERKARRDMGRVLSRNLMPEQAGSLPERGRFRSTRAMPLDRALIPAVERAGLVRRSSIGFTKSSQENFLQNRLRPAVSAEFAVADGRRLPSQTAARIRQRGSNSLFDKSLNRPTCSLRRYSQRNATRDFRKSARGDDRLHRHSRQVEPLQSERE